MKKIISSLILICGGLISVSAQQSQPVPQRTPSPAEESQRMIREQRELQARFDALRNTGTNNRKANLSRASALRNIQNIYRKPTREEFKLLAPDKEDLNKYARFLRQSNTGLLKLIADKGCAEHTNVVNVSEDCLKYSMPGAGASYSFRTKSHRIRNLSDLTYVDNAFHSSGILTHAILVNIGDIPLEQISMQTGGLKFLTDFETVSDYEKAKEIDLRFMRGIENNGFFYSRSADAGEHTTYVLRSIAYRGNYFRTSQGVVYDEFDFDERRDITVAFRIVRRDGNSVTILWKELTNQKSPLIKRNQERRKSEENKFVGKDEIG
jgi:hypothetical protein